MLSFGWLPLVGPIIDGVVSIFTKFQDTELGKYKIDGEVDVAAWKAANELTMAFQNSISVRLARDIVMFPGAIWCGLFIEGKIMDKMYPEWVWPVSALTGPMSYLPFALMAFFFGMAAIKR